MTTYTSPFSGQTVYPSATSYESISISANTPLQWPVNGNDNTVASAIIDVTATIGPATFTGSISGTTLTVSSVASGAVMIGQTITGTSIAANTVITAGAGTSWTVSISQTIASETMVAASLELQMPPAAQVSTGQNALIRNIGAYPFTVTDTSGNTIASIASGIADFIWVTNNATSNGVWASITFGAGTASANAATLAGNGLEASGSTLNTIYPLTAYYSSATLAATNQAGFNVWGGGVGTFTLPASGAVGNGWFTIVRNAGTGIVTVNPTGTDTIDGNASQQMQLTNSMVFVSNGSTGYSSFGLGQSTQFAFTQLSLPVTGGTVTLTSAQGANIIQNYSGTLTSNAIIVLPSTVNLYVLTNNTTGAYTLTFKTAASSGTTVTVPQGQTLTVVCDGINIFSAVSSISGSITSVTLNPGSAANPTFNFAGNLTTGLYLPNSNQIGFTVNGANAMTLTATGLLIPVGISGGTF